MFYSTNNLNKPSQSIVDLIYKYNFVTKNQLIKYHHSLQKRHINEILDEKFLLNDYSILVTGSKPQEILSLLLVLEHYNNKNIKVLLSFTSELALDKISEFLSNAVNKYFRVPYSDEYFIYNIANTQVYNDIFRFTEEEFTDAVKREKEKNKKSKLRFFRKEGKSKEKNKKDKNKDKGKKQNHKEKEDKE